MIAEITRPVQEYIVVGTMLNGATISFAFDDLAKAEACYESAMESDGIASVVLLEHYAKKTL